MHVQEQKEQLRIAIRERIGQLQRALEAESCSLSKTLLQLIPPSAKTICAYSPLQDEADIRPLIASLLERGCSIYFPRYNKETMEFRQAKNLDDLAAGAYGIPEPLANAPLLAPQKADLVLVPGRAFDLSGHRLGRGNGGYDRWISIQRQNNPNTLFWGVSWDCQIVPEVPVEAHDASMDAVVTARGVVQAKP